jgi:hypothetical protein
MAKLARTEGVMRDECSEHGPFPHQGGAFWIFERHAVVAEAT